MDFKLPEIGEGVQEGEVVRWLVKEGGALKKEQPLVEIMTDKATVEIVSPVSGTLAKIIVPEGKLCKVHGTLAELSTGDAKTASAPAPKDAPKASTPTASAKPAVSTPAPASGELARAFPATRKMARELGINLNQVSGTGPEGRVTKMDLQQFQGKSEGALANLGRSSAPVSREDERVALRGIRRKIAQNMMISKQHVPHFTTGDECDFSELVTLKNSAKEVGLKRGVKMTFLPFIIKALVKAAKEYPIVNSSLDEEKEEIVFKKNYNIGIAVATDDGLVVPVLKHADQKNIWELAAEIERLAKAAREKKLKPEDFHGGTITITNIGSVGGSFATPIINWPEVAIIGVYKIQEKPVIRNGQIVIRNMGSLTATCDHRLIDGSVATQFLNELIKYVSDPKLFLMDLL